MDLSCGVGKALKDSADSDGHQQRGFGAHWGRNVAWGKNHQTRLTYWGHVMRSVSIEKAMMLGIFSGMRRGHQNCTDWILSKVTMASTRLERMARVGL